MSRTITLKDLVKLNIKTTALTISNKKNRYGPSEMVIANILNYSKALSIRETSFLGAIEMILN